MVQYFITNYQIWHFIHLYNYFILAMLLNYMIRWSVRSWFFPLISWKLQTQVKKFKNKNSIVSTTNFLLEIASMKLFNNFSFETWKVASDYSKIINPSFSRSIFPITWSSNKRTSPKMIATKRVCHRDVLYCHIFFYPLSNGNRKIWLNEFLITLRLLLWVPLL